MNHKMITDLDDLETNTGLGLKVRRNEVRRKGKRLLTQRGSQQIERTVTPFEEADYPFTYHASRHEKQWLLGSINEFYQQDWIEDILKMVNGGKEATVYLCSRPATALQHLLAAKIYRPRQFRNLKKDHLYREGRDQLDAAGKVIIDDRSLHAMRKRTTYGQVLLHSSWIGHEYRTMQLLADAGVDMPRPFASSDNAILMDFVGDEFESAPTLHSVTLSSTEARQLFERVLFNIELMLRFNRVHADLSAYNILYWQGSIKLIDFPQAINPDENHNAYRIFTRDVERICEYFTTQGVKTDPAKLASSMWKSRGRLTVPDLDPLFLDPEKEEDRWAWNRPK